ncbi:MAG: sulfite exporter TauE/SafE family protein [Pseudomonadota bacterium]
MLDLETALICAAALFVGGFTKGIAGLGLPMVAIPLLAFAVNLPTAVTLLVLPTVVSNLFQAFQRGAFLSVIRRFRWLLILFIPTIGVGAKLLVTLDERLLYAVLGVAVLAITVLIRVAPSFALGPRAERVLNPVVGGDIRRARRRLVAVRAGHHWSIS